MRLAAIALGFTLAASGRPAAPAGRSNEAVTFDATKTRIRYVSTEVDEVHPLVLEVTGDGAARLQVGSNADAPERHAAGLFAAAVPAAEAAALRAALAAPEFASAPEPEGLAPGTPLRTLALAQDGEEVVARSASGARPPPAFAAAEARARGLAARLASAPVQALSSRLVSAAVRPEAPGILELALELTNAGAQPLALAPPAEGPPGTSLVVNALREGVPPDQFRAEDQLLLEVAPERLSAQPALEAGKPLAIPPGGKRLLRVALPLSARPGAWRVRAQLETAFLDDRGVEQGRYEVHSNAVVFRM
jgi:hypothetical protein